MLKDPKSLIKLIHDHILLQKRLSKRNNLVLDFDGSLMSIVNVFLLQSYNPIITLNIFNQNKNSLSYLLLLSKRFNLTLKTNNLTSLEASLPIEYKTLDHILFLKEAFLEAEARQSNGLVIGNSCYSQIVTTFPKPLNNNSIYILGSLFYSEVQELAHFLTIPSDIINREPSHYLFKNQIDRISLEFDYTQLEAFLRNKAAPTSIVENKIRDRVYSHSEINFKPEALLIQRPSNLLG